MSAPFVGRQRELGELATVIRQSRLDRAPVAALVTGEPGSGKTRLLGEILARQGQARTIRVVGFEPNQAVPLAAVGDLLRELSSVPVHGPSLEGLVFGGGGQAPRAPLRIYEAAHRAQAAYGPLLVGVDDLQWVDDQSLGLIHYLLRAAEPARQPLVVIAVARPSAAANAVRSTLEAGLPPDRRRVLELGPMPLDDGLALTRSIDDTLDRDAATAVWQRARGSPFWLEALARSGSDAEPAQLIGERLRALGSDSGGVLAALAVGARPFLLDEVAELLDWPADRVRLASDELILRGLVVKVGGTVRLAHDLIREAATASLPASSRRRLHARLADWIEHDGDDDVSLLREALDHRVAAGQPTAGLAVRLLASPGRRLLNADDLRLLASISDGLAPGGRDRIRLDEAIAELGAAIGEVDVALERWTRVSEQSCDVSERRRAEIASAWTAYRTGRRAAAHEHLDRARALPSATPAELVRLEAIQADVELWLDHETAAGSATAARALAAADEMAMAAGGVDVLPAEGRRAFQAAIEVAIDGAMQESRDTEIPGLAQQCVRVSASLDEESHISAQIRAGQAMRTVTRAREGEALDRQAWDASKRLVLPGLTVGAGRELARALRDLGRLADAHAVAVETSQLEARLSDAYVHWGSAPSIGHVIELSIDDAATALRSLRRDAAAESDPHYSQDVHLAIAMWRARVAGPAAAAEVDAELTAAHADAELARCPRHLEGLALATAELLARIGRVEDARHALADWERRSQPGSVNRDLWWTRALAEIAAADGDHVAASSLLETLADRLEQRGLRFQLLWTRLDLGRSLVHVDRGRAVAAFAAAADLAGECGAVSEGRIAAQALRKLGVRAWRRGAAHATSGTAGLSGREREIAGRVAKGESNREIADALVVSPKTVERHVTNILAKTGLRNRTEFASLVRSSPVRDSPDE
ncbi:MAG: AAA family ATPase [Chloroflexi bacterium]|nr:AAA family ATPase [Chloroflexota bacterium]